MRQHLLIVLLFSVLPQLVTAGQLTDENERLTQRRDLRWVSDVQSVDPQSMGLSITVFFDNDGAPYQLLTHLVGSFERAEYSKCHFVIWLADGAPVKPMDQEYQALPLEGQGAYLEVFTSEFSSEDFQHLASADSVEYKVCNTLGAVPAEDLEGLRQIQAHLNNS